MSVKPLANARGSDQSRDRKGADDSNVVVLGEYSNLRHTGDHEYGYRVQLWREAGTVFGLIMVYDGPPSDPPTGLLEGARLDPRTGKLEFKPRLSLDPGDAKRPASHDVFTFNGVWRDREITGVLARSDGASGRVRLARDAESDLERPASYEEWKRGVREVLKLRGPKW